MIRPITDYAAYVLLVLAAVVGLVHFVSAVAARDERLHLAAACADEVIPQREPTEAWKEAFGACLRVQR